MALKLGELVAYLRTDNSRLERGLDKAERDFRDTGKQLEADAKTAGAAMGAGLFTAADGRLRDGRGRFAKAGSAAGAAAGVAGASEFSMSFMQRLGPLLTKSPIPMPVVAALAAPLAIGMSAAISGAVVGGVGIGGVLGGLAIASQHADVRSAAETTGDAFTQVMRRAGVSFVPATVGALADVRSEILSMEGDFQRVFSKASRYVAPLTRGVTGFVKNLMPGVEDAIDRAGPVIDEIASWGPRLGTMLSDVFSDFSDNASEGARALATFWMVLEFGVRSIAGVINGLTEVYGFLDLSLAVLRGDVGTMAKYATEEAAVKKGGDELNPTLQGLIDGFSGVGEKAETAAQKNERLLDTLKRLTGASQSARMATMDFEEGLDALTESVALNGTTLDVGSEAGRANLRVIESLISASDRAGQAAEDRALAEGKSAEEAAAAGALMRSTFIADLEAAARKAGLSKTRIAEMVAEIKKADGQRARLIVETIYKQTGKPGTEFGGIGGQHFKGYASGGRPDPRVPIVVGEKGWEVFVPDGPGRIVPHHEAAAAARSTAGTTSGAGGGGLQELLLRGEFRVRGSDLVLIIRDQVRDLTGGDVQAALGWK